MRQRGEGCHCPTLPCCNSAERTDIVNSFITRFRIWDVTRTDALVPSQHHDSENMTVLVFLQYVGTGDAILPDLTGIYAYKCSSLSLNAKVRQIPTSTKEQHVKDGDKCSYRHHREKKEEKKNR